MVSEFEGEAQEATPSDDNIDISLSNTQRVSGRNRKRIRHEDDDFIHY
jgi:hypothetical protein